MSGAINYKIYGSEMQMLEVELKPGQGVRAEPGVMLFMEDGIEMETSTGGGILKGLKRMFTGSNFFISSFKNKSYQISKVGFAAPYPGKIVPLELSSFNGSFICQKDSFLCAETDIEIEMTFTKRLGAGFFGGEGFVLQRLTGNGMAFVHSGGTVIERSLQTGESLRVETGCLVGFSPTVDYDVQFIGGFKNTIFGGEGLFFARLKGPGVVLLQTLPFSRLADRIFAASRVGVDKTTGAAAVGGGLLGGSLLGDLFSGGDDNNNDSI